MTPWRAGVMTGAWRRRTILAVGLVIGWTAVAPGQEYRVRLDTRAQSVSFRGLIADSIPAAEAVPGTGGGFETVDGHAVRCGAGDYCFFFRPGPTLRAVPMTASASVILWGLGVPGLTVHASGRVVADFGRDEVWPGTDPAVQLVEGFVEYDRSIVRARAGRQLVHSRLEPIGFDGGWLRVRWDRAALEFTGYGGWGLGQASALAITSPALDPLDEFRPRDRQLVAGAEAAWIYQAVDVRAEYRREIDPRDDYFVSERTAMSVGARAGPMLFAGGFDYNIAEGNWGSADVRATYLQRRFSVTAGARRYRPYFPLWTLWSAFSPVPYHAVNVSGELRATDRISVNARGEWYKYEDSEASTALVPVLEDRGWRASGGAGLQLAPSWRLNAMVGAEHGPGAASQFANATVSFRPNEVLAFELYGGALERPLELRFYDATSRWIGGHASWEFLAPQRVWADVSFIDDDRDRPDASATSLSQVRARAGVSLTFGTSADRVRLPPARRTGQ